MTRLAALALALSVPASAQIGSAPGGASGVHPQIVILQGASPAVRQRLMGQIAKLPTLSVQAKQPIEVEAAKQLFGLLANSGIAIRHEAAVHDAFDVNRNAGMVGLWGSPASRATRDLVFWSMNSDPSGLELVAPRLHALGAALAEVADVPSARAALDAAWDNLGPEADESFRYRRPPLPSEIASAKHYSLLGDFDPGEVSDVHPLITILQASPPGVRRDMMLQLASLPDISPFRQADYARILPDHVDPVRVEAAKLLVGFLVGKIVAYNVRAINEAFAVAALDVTENKIGWWRNPATQATEALFYWGEKFARNGLHGKMGASAPQIGRFVSQALLSAADVPSARAALDAAWD